MQTKFNFYQDPAHGWLKVPMKLLKELKIEKEISYCSYYRKGYVYLEEDCDLLKFLEAMENANNWVISEQNIRPFHTNRTSKIRTYKIYDREIA